MVAHNHQLNEAQLNHLLRCYAGNEDFETREHFYYSYAIYIYLETLHYWIEVGHDLQSAQEQVLETNIDTLVGLLHRLGA